MSDFRVHPALTSPPVAAVVMAVVGMSMVDAGIAGVLREIGETSLDAASWGNIVASRWGVGGISAALGWFAWFVMFGNMTIRVPTVGVLLGVIGPILSLGMIWLLYRSIQMPEFQAAAPMIWRIAMVWSGLMLLVCVGCIRLGLRSYRMIRGQ